MLYMIFRNISEIMNAPEELGKRSLKIRNHLQQPVYIGDTKTDQVSCCKAGIPFIYASFGFGEADDYAASVDTFSKLAQLFLTEQ